MGQKRSDHNAGVTLLELTFAMAIFAVALGATAQALVSYYVALDVQGRRATALEHCRTVLGSLREIRDSQAGTFVTEITEWVAEQESAGGDENYSGLFDTMPGETVTTACSELYSGGAPADPLRVVVTSVFEDTMGRPVSVQLESVLTQSM